MSLQRMLASVATSVRALFLGQVTRSQNASPWPLAQVALEDGTVLNDVPRLQPYGFGSEPPADAIAIVTTIAGKPATLLVDHGKFRIELLQGEVALYNDKGDCVKLGTDRRLTLLAGTEVVIDAPSVTCTGTLQAAHLIANSVTDSKGTMQAMRDTYNVHTHASVGLPPTGQME